jgi:hypothetical protein
MNVTDQSLKERGTAGPRILLTDTNRWPVVPRLAISFRRMGCTVGVLCPTPGHPVQKLSSIGPIFHYSGFTPISSLRTAIEAFNPDIIVPSCDRGVQHLHELHAIVQSKGSVGDKIAALIERSLGAFEGYSIVSSRCELLKIAQTEGILTPKTVAIENDADLQLLNAESVSPWVIKADGTWGGQGVRIANDIAESERYFFEFAQPAKVGGLIKKMLLNRDRDWVLYDWEHSRRSVIGQSMINGRPANCAVVCWQGKVLAGIAVEVIKSRGETGPATVVQIVPGTEMIAAAEKLARRLKISGFFGLDFIIENYTGDIYLIEMNPRCTPPCSLPLGSNHNLVAAMWAQLAGQPVPENQFVIEQSVIAYFPQASECTVDVDDANLSDSIYCDIPWEEPELIEELLHPWSGRSLIGRLADLFRRKQQQKITSIAVPIPETGTVVSTAETLTSSKAL